MVAVTDLDILFGNPHQVYKAGDLVTGTCVLTAVENVIVQGLLLKFSGKAMSGFSKGSGGKHRNHYFAKERYFSTEVKALRTDASSDTTLTAGRHEFPFEFQLNHNLPSSFEGAYGFVRYAVKATLRMGLTSNMTIKHHFIVFSPLDLNTHRLAKRHSENKGSKTLCCMCCASGSLSARAWLEKRGIVPGEAIPLYAVIKNESSSKMSKSFFTIRQITTYRAMGQTETETKDLKSPMPPVTGPSIPAGETYSWNGEHSIICPITAPTGLEGCSLITTEHQLVLHVVPSGPSLDLIVAVGIVIGTEPLTDGNPAAHELTGYTSRDYPHPDREYTNLQPTFTAQPVVHSGYEYSGRDFQISHEPTLRHSDMEASTQV